MAGKCIFPVIKCVCRLVNIIRKVELSILCKAAGMKGAARIRGADNYKGADNFKGADTHV